MIAALAMTVSSTAFAASDVQPSPQLAQSQQQGPLSAGSAAGIQKAQGWDTDATMWVIGVAVIAGGICLAVCGGGNHNSSTTNTSPK
jgi:hypothetical protein